MTEQNERNPTARLEVNIDLEWENISFEVLQKDYSKRLVLDGLSGRSLSGDLMAIMGPSGCGKTTLMNILAARLSDAGKESMKVGGSVRVNGKTRDKNKFRRISAYVTQDDDLYAHLTVSETLMVAAHFFLSAHVSEEQKLALVDAVLSVLGLNKVRHTIIGDDMLRGISGGEKKRVAIAAQLLTDPAALFLDEPTSGLDAFQAQAVVDCLRSLSGESNRLVVCVIHQPRSSIYDAFDTLLLLSRGRTMYFGDAFDAVEYFSRLGYTCPDVFNPADYFMDLVSPDSRSIEEEQASDERIDRFARFWQQQQQREAGSSAVYVSTSNEERGLVPVTSKSLTNNSLLGSSSARNTELFTSETSADVSIACSGNNLSVRSDDDSDIGGFGIGDEGTLYQRSFHASHSLSEHTAQLYALENNCSDETALRVSPCISPTKERRRMSGGNSGSPSSPSHAAHFSELLNTASSRSNKVQMQQQGSSKSYKFSPYSQKSVSMYNFKRLAEADQIFSNCGENGDVELLFWDRTMLWVEHIKLRTRRSIFLFSLLSWRAWTEQSRNWPMVVGSIVMTIFFALLIGGLYSGMGTGQDSIRDRGGALFFIVVNQAMTSFGAGIPLFLLEKNTVRRERQSGIYSTLPYLMSKYIVELPINTLPVILFATIVHRLAGFRMKSYYHFIIFLLILSSSGTLLALCVTAVVPTIETALVVGMPILVLSIVFGGYYITIDALPMVADFIPNLSMMRWAFHGMMNREFDGLVFTCDAPNPAACVRTGEQVLETLSFDGPVEDPIFGGVFLVVALFILAYILLLSTHRSYLSVGHTGNRISRYRELKRKPSPKTGVRSTKIVVAVRPDDIAIGESKMQQEICGGDEKREQKAVLPDDELCELVPSPEITPDTWQDMGDELIVEHFDVEEDAAQTAASENGLSIEEGNKNIGATVGA